MTPQKPEPVVVPFFDAEAARYPGGDDAPAYRWVFNLWVVLFLGVICAGLLNYLGTYAKTFWPDL